PRPDSRRAGSARSRRGQGRSCGGDRILPSPRTRRARSYRGSVKETPPKRTPLWRKLLFAAVPCVVFFLLLEGIFRVAGWGAPETTPPSSADWKEVTLAAPDGTRSVYREGVYVGAPVRTNEHGFRDWLYDRGNAEHALRIAGVV